MNLASVFYTLTAISIPTEAVLEEPYGQHVVHVHNYGTCCDHGMSNMHEHLVANISTMLDGYTLAIKRLSHNLSSEYQRFDSNTFANNVVSLLSDKVFITRPRDCQDIQKLGVTITGVYKIFPEGTQGFSVRCDMDTTSGGWTVIQRRISESDFYRTWIEYQFGFGNLSENFWLGNQQIHTITSQGWYQLRVDLGNKDGEKAFAEYKLFGLGDSSSAYQLRVEGYSGNAGDALVYHNDRKFTTKDKDNDDNASNCAVLFIGAWWYGSCHDSNLNGEYGNTEYAKGPVWEFWKGYYEPLAMTEMKIRRWTD